METNVCTNAYVAECRQRRLRNRLSSRLFRACNYFLILIIVLFLLTYNKPLTFAKVKHNIEHKTIFSSQRGTTIPLTLKKPVVRHLMPSTQQHSMVIEDQRINKLHTFLVNQHSPFADEAPIIVQLADRYAIDYTLVPAIAGKESGFGRNIKAGSFNAWGVMAWNNGHRFIRSFASWTDAITFETQLLSQNYKLSSNEAIAATYCPSSECSSTWAEEVTEFSNAINKN